MRYTITESKLTSSIYKYIDNLPELKNLEELDCSGFDYDVGFHVEEICFSNEETDDVIFSYYPFPENDSNLKTIRDSDYKESLDDLPAIRLNDKLTNFFNSFFNDSWKKPFKEWFVSKYNMEVKTIFD